MHDRQLCAFNCCKCIQICCRNKIVAHTNLLQKQLLRDKLRNSGILPGTTAGPFSHKLLRKSHSQAGLVDFSVYTLSSSKSAKATIFFKHAILQLRNLDFLQSSERKRSANMMSCMRINGKEIPVLDVIKNFVLVIVTS